MFTKFKFDSDEEELFATTLTLSNQQYIQNLIADAASEKAMLTFNPVNPHEFIQREAELQGTIRALQGLLDASAIVQAEIAAKKTQI